MTRLNDKAKPSLSRRAVFSSALAAGAALAIPATAMAQAETSDDARMEVFQKQIATLGKALHDGRIDVKWVKAKSGRLQSGKFTIVLGDTDAAEFMGTLFAGTVFAGLITKDELIAKLDKERNA